MSDFFDQPQAAAVLKHGIAGAPGGWSCYDIGVADTWQGAPAYNMLFLTQQDDGVWQFHQALSSAHEEHRQFCHTNEGMFDLEPLAQREARWVEHIEANVERILKDRPSFAPVRNMKVLFGDAFGEARETHLRKALNNMYADGRISTNPRGVKSLANFTIKR